MHEVVKVQLRSAGETKHFITNGLKLEIGSKVIVEADRGLESGVVVSANEKIEDLSKIEQPLRKIIRKANPWDEQQLDKNTAKTKDLMGVCAKKIEEHKLPMKLVDAEYSFDRSKIIFYFTSENRVDFRNLVRDLASIFRVRIELRQIGVRDEARMLGGHGPCGRELCCMSFLKDFNPVTIKMAKVQNLPLNPSKISGLCGRLMCCLGYEYNCYKECCKGLPKAGKEIKTEQGKGKVIGVNPLKRTITVNFGDGKIKEINLDEKEEKQ
ncbi:MAG: stage 0 sporulation family protein [Candidatus Omnitrophota bacterium]